MNSNIDAIRLWPFATIIAVAISWLLYRCLSPATWREWSGAGLVQGFIIALYAEMYGFPLTIYIVASLTGLDLPLGADSGHLWATLLGLGRRGAAAEALVGLALTVVGVLMIMRGWLAIYMANGALLSYGVYGIVRHPQYAGIVITVIGQLLSWPTLFTALLAGPIILVYWRLARREEHALLYRFGDAYREYQGNVPMFLPSRRGLASLLPPRPS